MPEIPAVNPLLEWAIRYIRLKWAVFPCRGKEPLTTHGFKEATLNENQARAWWAKWPEANIGIATGHRFWVLDVDIKTGGDYSLRYLVNQHGALPDTLEQQTGGGGRHFFFSMPDFPVRNSTGAGGSGIAEGIDVRGVGGYIIAPPSIHPETKRAYDWDGLQEIEDQPIAPAPPWLLDKLRARPAAGKFPPAQKVAERISAGGRNSALFKVAASLRGKGFVEEEILATLRATNQARCEPPLPDDELRVIALSAASRYTPDTKGKLFTPPHSEGSVPPRAERDDLNKKFPLGLADVEAAADVAIERKSPADVMRLVPEIAKLRLQHQAVIVAKFREGFGSEWREHGKWFERALREECADKSGGGDGAAAPPDAAGGDGGYPDLLFYPLTDAGNGERLIALYEKEVRFCVEMDKWLHWDGKRWAVDASKAQLSMRGKAVRMARILYQQAQGRSGHEKHARASEQYSAIGNAIGSAADKLKISATELDQHPYLLNCPNGVIDLRTGKLLPHDRAMLITKLCPIEYDQAAECPRFLAFLQWAMGANPDSEVGERTMRLVSFIQRGLGYSLTGDVGARVLFVCYGAGKNGKTTLLTLFRDLLGRDYSGQLVIDTVMSMKNQDATARADLADLRGVRFVMTSEVEKEHKFDEGKIKYITGGMGAAIKSCRKYENPIEFFPTHKLWMDCNHLPRVRGTDEGIWDRLLLIPFLARIDESDKDEQLPLRLRAEAKGVLAWAVRGSIVCHKEKLGKPPEVTDAGGAWREHDDPLREFVEDCCSTEGGWVMVCDMAAAYEWWCKQHRERFPVGREAFNERMEAKGFKRANGRRCGLERKQERTWEGLELKSEVVAAIQAAGLRRADLL